MSQPPAPMLPSNALVMAANKALASPDFRESVRQMHAEGYPLVKMVDALGLEEDMTKRIRQILEDLPADVVEGIRKATLEMLDSADYVMPLDCTVTDKELEEGIPVDVEVAPESGVDTIHVRPLLSS
jgi:ABC-type thiamine transport system substrate-binding protein